MSKHRSFTPEFKAQVVLEVLSGAKSAAEVCREHQLEDSLFFRWKDAFLKQAPKPSSRMTSSSRTNGASLSWSSWLADSR